MRRVFRRRKKQVEEIGSIADQNIDKHIFRRLLRLANVRRFVIGWVLIVGLMMMVVILQTRTMESHYKQLKPTAGGIYTEGMVGSFTDVNPIYATNTVDASVAKLVFAGLLKYDSKGGLVNDLAEKLEVNEGTQTYTVHLKPNLTWHDGKPLTAKDVVFTYRLIQNPDARSFLEGSWRGIKVNAIDNSTVSFTLPNKLSAFPYSLTTGILPEHILKDVPAEQLRSNKFNTQNPIGSGPFKFDKVQVSGSTDKREERVGLSSFDEYNAGKPKINKFIIKTYKSEDKLVNAYTEKQVDAMANVASLPDQLENDSTTQEFSSTTLSQVAVFFRTTQPPLNDVAVRNALVAGASRAELISGIHYPVVPSDEPLLKTQIGYNKAYAQVAAGDVAKASQLLDSAGWVKNPNTGIREKNGTKLTFRLVSQSSSEYSAVARILQKQWQDIGVDVQISLQPEQELQPTIAQHSYDALLYAIAIGRDPDVFAYWHSSQADVRSQTRLNFSEYQSTSANEGLEGGRTRYDPNVRSIKYKSFLEAWQKDSPALVLYQPRYLYVARKPFSGYNVAQLNSVADRFVNVENWTIKESYQL